MFSNLNLYHLRNSEFVQYSDYILETIKTKNPEHLQVKEIYDKISSKSQLLTSIFKPDRGSEITPRLEEADDRRDSAITGITGALEFLTSHYDPEKRDLEDMENRFKKFDFLSG